MTDLRQIRERIDEIDRQIQELFERRMQCSNEVAAYKIENGLQVFDKGREEEKLSHLSSNADSEFNSHAIRELYQQIMGISRKAQYQIMAAHGLKSTFDFKKIKQVPRDNVSVVYQGVEGAYSHAAAKAYFHESCRFHHVEQWKDAMDEIKSGAADYAVLPIENSTAGSVYDNYDLLAQYDHTIVGEQLIRCRHALLAVPGAKISDIRSVYSHPQALSQCREYLEHHPQWEQKQYANTAMAAKKVALDDSRTQAAIASEFAAQEYGLSILAEHIYDKENNSTRFIVVSRDRVFEEDADKISICIELPHKSGTLYRILSHFIFNNLNMTKIESRPRPDKDWEYRFFIDFEGSLTDDGVQNALDGIAKEANSVRIFGNY